MARTTFAALVRKVSVQCLLKDAYESACRLGMCSINGVSLIDAGMELKTRLRFKLEGHRHFHDFPVDGDMVPTGGSLKCRKFSGTFSGR